MSRSASRFSYFERGTRCALGPVMSNQYNIVINGVTVIPTIVTSEYYGSHPERGGRDKDYCVLVPVGAS